MRGNDSKLRMLVVLAAMICCALPLLFLVSGGAVFAIAISSLTNNIYLLILGLILISFCLVVFKKGEKP